LTIQRNWQHRVHKTTKNKAKTQHNMFIFLVFLYCPVMCLSSEFRLNYCGVRYDFRMKTMFGSFLPPVDLLEGIMSYLRYLCLFACSGVHHILCCVFALFFVVLCTLCCQFLWIARTSPYLCFLIVF
jgi:hypothetical protein